MKYFTTLGGRIVGLVAASILITLIVALIVLSSSVKKTALHGLEAEMRATLLQAESTTDSIGNLGQGGAFDYAKLAEDLKKVGRENFRESLLYQTVPVVAAWEAVRKSTKGTPVQFRIARNNPRYKGNAPENELEKNILRDFENSATTEVFIQDSATGVIAYARPVVMSQSCMVCHGDPATSKTGDGRDILGFQMENWKAGQRQGAYILTVPMSYVNGPVLHGILTAAGWVLPAGVLVILGALTFVRGTNRRLERNIADLGEGSDQVASASGQISTASQSLAEGASEQAASLEETSASLEEIASMTKRNAENALNAKTLSSDTRQAAETGSVAVEEMNRAMADIQSASSNISKIIKTIDEIAFQTNILALNAAVEAAHAGEAGAGFAVVADEVRNLAQRSAQAAKETAEKIEDSISKSANGVAISGKVTESLTQIVTKARQVDDLVAEIATASREQSQGIDQVNTAVTQMDQVTQANAATAEESASASEELSAQAATLRELVAGLQRLVTGSASAGQPGTPREVLHTRPHRTQRPAKSAAPSRPALGSYRPALSSSKRKDPESEIPMEGDFRDF